MNFEQILATVLGGVVIMSIGGWIVVRDRVTSMTTRLDSVEKGCQDCKTEMKQSVNQIRNDVADHHSRGPHITEDFRELVISNFDAIGKRLEGIEGYLRKNGHKRDEA